MMATAAAAALLDELMGRCRNVGPDEQATEMKWSDEEVCKYFLVKFCPNELFVNTKADLGQCHRIHDEEMRKKYEEEKGSRPSLRMEYEDEFIRFCQEMITEVEKKIKKGKERLALAQSKSTEVDKRLMSSNTGDVKSHEERLIYLSEKIEALCNQAEEAGTRGDVEEAQTLMTMCDELREQKETLLRTSMESSGTSPWIQAAELTPQEKLMEVCEICGSFLIVGDAQSRIDDHLLGKQHMGYARLRVSVEEIIVQRRAEQEEREKRREREREERRKRMDEKGRGSKSRDRDRERGRDSDREKDRDRGRDHHRVKSEHSTKSNRHRSRSRSKSRRSLENRDGRSKSRTDRIHDEKDSRSHRERSHGDPKRSSEQERRRDRSKDRSSDRHSKSDRK